MDKEEISKYIKTLSDYDKIQKILIKVLGKILVKENNFEYFIKENNDKIIHIRDWISSIVENNEEWKSPRVLTIEALNNSANKYFEKQNNKIQKIELNEEIEKLVVDLDDFYVVQMLTPEALDNESKVMQHCIGHGGYDKKLKNPEYKYLSLRDKYNKAHATLEIRKNEILQLQGKQNKVPEEKYVKSLLPWLVDNNYKNIPYFKLGYYVGNDNILIQLKDIKIKEKFDYISFRSHDLDIIESKNEIFGLYHFYHKTNPSFLYYNNSDFPLKYIINNKYFFYLNNKHIFSNIKYKDENKQEILNIIQFLYDNNQQKIVSSFRELYVVNNKVYDIRDLVMKNDIDYIQLYKNDYCTIDRIISEQYMAFIKYTFYQNNIFDGKYKDFHLIKYNNNICLVVLSENKVLKILMDNKQQDIENILNILDEFKYDFDIKDYNCYKDENNKIRTLKQVNLKSLKKDIDYILEEEDDLKISFAKSNKYIAFMEKNHFGSNININDTVFIKSDKEKNIQNVEFYQPTFIPSFSLKVLKYLMKKGYKNINTGSFSKFINKLDSKIYSFDDIKFPDKICIEDTIDFSQFKNLNLIKDITFEDNFFANNFISNFNFENFNFQKGISFKNTRFKNLP